MTSTRFEAVIFDWAGTTVDYGCFAPVRAFQEAFKEFGIEPTMDETRKPMGMLKHDHISTMLHMDRIARAWEDAHGAAPTEADVDSVYAHFEPKLLSILDQFATPKPGVVDTVATLREMGLKIGSTTGYTDKMMEIVVPKAAEQGYAPDFWISPDGTDGFGRPYPYMVFENLKTLRVTDVRKAVKVGDTLSDIREGKNAGVFTVGVTEGSSQMALSQDEFEALSDADKAAARTAARNAFTAAGADAVIDTMAELPALLRQIA
ncbi:phosphonoacetaldehyde hydrolase [Bifidobacterium vespertilionis]|uniref:Phosphonoacetaldehyde hydrolase n=1 Tax=Bifidobacterium vespertilionis TaxID=2562524 RepID=A0A5J5DYN9_9BIFI|nr:phosphonoacetaldehyde hydrolase [Bifidobacterium vespertilionis]KAA8822007.1 phosphonoacetaldehyde hydrolase [Bifidobacterium vespertilionis]KAA8823552.1 phosphonoacetaldehyde hydrolase [Bifidobacterium vespertilionis]